MTKSGEPTRCSGCEVYVSALAALIRHSGSKAQDKGIPETIVCRILLLTLSFGPVTKLEAHHFWRHITVEAPELGGTSAQRDKCLQELQLRLWVTAILGAPSPPKQPPQLFLQSYRILVLARVLGLHRGCVAP